MALRGQQCGRNTADYCQEVTLQQRSHEKTSCLAGPKCELFLRPRTGRELSRRQDGPGILPLHVPHEALQYPQCSRDKIQPIKQKQSRHHAMTALLMFSKFQGWGSGIPTGRLFRCTEWSAAESLARFSPPGSAPGTPSPGFSPGSGLCFRSLLPILPCWLRIGAVLLMML